MDLERLKEPCKHCTTVQWKDYQCAKCGTSYCFTCACRESWTCPRCGSELV